MEKMLENLGGENTKPKEPSQEGSGRWWEKPDYGRTGSVKRELAKDAPKVFADSAETEKDALSMNSRREEQRETHAQWLERRGDETKKIAKEKYHERISESDESRLDRIKDAKDKDPLFYQNLGDEEILKNLDWFDAENKYKKEHGTIKRSETSRIYDEEGKPEKTTNEKSEEELSEEKEVDKADNGAPVKKPEEELNKNKSDDGKTEKTIKADKTEKKSGERISEKAKKQVELARDEKYGIDRSSLKSDLIDSTNKLGSLVGVELFKETEEQRINRKPSAGWQLFKNFIKGGLNSAGSLIGVRVGWEYLKLRKGEKRRGAVGEIMDSLIEESRMTLENQGISEEEIKMEADKIEQDRLRHDNIDAHNFAREALQQQDPPIKEWTPEAKTFLNKIDRKNAIEKLRKEKGIDEKVKNRTKEEIVERPGPVRLKIRALEEKLKEAKMSPEDKEKLRHYLAVILADYRNKEKEAGDDKTKKIERVLDTYMNNKAQKLLVAKEALNTASIITIAPWLRLGGYAVGAGFERGAKAVSAYDKEHFDINKDKESLWGEKGKMAIKDVFLNSCKETARGLSFNRVFKEKGKNKNNWAKGGEFVSAFFTALRFAGLFEYGAMGYMGKLPTHDYDKLKDMIVNHDVIGAGLQAGKNWFGNLERLAGYAGIDLHKHLESAVGYAEKSSGVDIHNYLRMKSGSGANGAVDYEKFNKVFGTGPRGEVPSAEEIQRVKISSVFGADSPIAYKIMEGGVTQDETRLLDSLMGLGLHASDFNNFNGTPNELNHLVDQVSKLNLGVSQPGILKELISNPIAAKNFNNQAVQDILAKGKFSSEHIKDILSAKQIATIDKSGGSISEALGETIGHNDKVTVVNPDGSILEKFDANLVHKGDVVSLSDKGEIIVFKTSEVSVKAGQSLEKVYADIAGKLDKVGVPNEVRERFNEGAGYWGGKITHGESEKMLHWWNENKATYDHLTPEKQQEILRNIHSAKSDAEAGKMLNDIANAPAHSVAEAVAPHPAENVAPVEGYHDVKELKSDGAPDVSSWPLANQQHSKSDDKIFEFSANRTTVDRITTIFGEKKEQFSAPADLDKISAWKEVKGQLASDVISDKFIQPSGLFGWMSGRKIRAQYDDLQKYLINLNKDHNIPVNKKETVVDYIKRAEEWLSRERVYK